MLLLLAIVRCYCRRCRSLVFSIDFHLTLAVQTFEKRRTVCRSIRFGPWKRVASTSNMSFLPKTFYSVKPDARKEYHYERSPFHSVSLPALNYRATDRIVSLSKPTVRQETTVRDGNRWGCLSFSSWFTLEFRLGFSRYISDPTYSGVTKGATHARCSSRLESLSSPLKRHETYRYELPLPRPVPHGALKYVATTRVTELATPKKLPGVR